MPLLWANAAFVISKYVQIFMGGKNNAVHLLININFVCVLQIFQKAVFCSRISRNADRILEILIEKCLTWVTVEVIEVSYNTRFIVFVKTDNG